MTLIRTLAVALALAAFAVPTAQAKPVDSQYPAYPTPTVPSEDGPKNYSMNSATGDYRAAGGTGASGAADRADAAGPTRSHSQDIRMPDTADAAKGRGLDKAPGVTVVKVPTPSAPAASTSGGGIDWADAGIGAGGMLAMLVLAGGSAFAVVHRKRGLRTVA
jgi:hypothetical protein